MGEVAIHELMGQLAGEIRGRGDDYVLRAEQTLGQIAGLCDRDSIGLLLPLLDDDAEYDELMFSIIHIIEKFDDEHYVGEVLRHLPGFLTRSPRWAVIIHMRILNSASTLAAYGLAIKPLSYIEKQAASDALRRVRRKNARFEASVEALLEALR